MTRFFSDIGNASRGPRGEGEAETRGRLVPGRFLSVKSSGAEIGRARPAQKRLAGRKKHDFTFVYKAPLRGVGFSPRRDASWHAADKCGCYQRTRDLILTMPKN